MFDRKQTIARSMRLAAFALAFGALTASAQPPEGESPSQRVPPRKAYTRNRAFNLPIQMDEKTRAATREVQLYVKIGDGEWTKHEAVPATTSLFTFRMAVDGDYAFALITVDRDGNSSPKNVADLMPSIRVTVDTKPPRIEAAIAKEKDVSILSVKLLDEFPDSESVRAVVVTGTGERPLMREPDRLAFRLTPLDLDSVIRITGSDLSGNRATKDLSPKKQP